MSEFTAEDFKHIRVGAYVRIHPASDWFMRGVTQARAQNRPHLAARHGHRGARHGHKL